jgi:hypothetical protein
MRALFVDVLFRLIRRIRAELRWCTDFDERFDEFWAELESQNPGVLLSTRTRQTLEWHFRRILLKCGAVISVRSDHAAARTGY